MKCFDDLSQEEQNVAVIGIFREFVAGAVGDKDNFPEIVMFFDTEKEEECLEGIIEMAEETGDYAEAHLKVARRFYDKIMRMATELAQDSIYDDDGWINEGILLSQLH